jgi:hypothetical protein
MKIKTTTEFDVDDFVAQIFLYERMKQTPCNACKGAPIKNIDGNTYICSICKGTKHIETPKYIREWRAKEGFQITFIKFNKEGKYIYEMERNDNPYESEEEFLFSSLVLAQQECDKRNKVFKNN